MSIKFVIEMPGPQPPPAGQSCSRIYTYIYLHREYICIYFGFKTDKAALISLFFRVNIQYAFPFITNYRRKLISMGLDFWICCKNH